MTGPFVLDASMTLSWAFEGESTPFTVAVLKSLDTVHTIAPANTVSHFERPLPHGRGSDQSRTRQQAVSRYVTVFPNTGTQRL